MRIKEQLRKIVLKACPTRVKLIETNLTSFYDFITLNDLLLSFKAKNKNALPFDLKLTGYGQPYIFLVVSYFSHVLTIFFMVFIVTSYFSITVLLFILINLIYRGPPYGVRGKVALLFEDNPFSKIGVRFDKPVPDGVDLGNICEGGHGFFCNGNVLYISH